jgi:uncharacterized protein YxjI
MLRRNQPQHPQQPQQPQQQPQAAPGQQGPERYKMRERIFDIGEDFWIDTEGGRHAFKVDGKVLRARNTLNLEGPNGQALYQIQSRVLRVKDSMAIEKDGHPVAEVKKDLVNIVHDHFIVDMAGSGPNLDVNGNILDHEYKITRGGMQVAEISKKWVRVRDTYTIDVAPGQDAALMICITVAVDQLASGDRNRR